MERKSVVFTSLHLLVLEVSFNGSGVSHSILVSSYFLGLFFWLGTRGCTLLLLFSCHPGECVWEAFQFRPFEREECSLLVFIWFVLVGGGVGESVPGRTFLKASNRFVWCSPTLHIPSFSFLCDRQMSVGF